MNKDETNIFREQRNASPDGETVRDYLEQHKILTPDQPSEYDIPITQFFDKRIRIDVGHIPDGTAGHSKGNWYYFGETFVGIQTDCQHPHIEPANPITGDYNVVYPDFDHENDIILPGTDEGEFEQLMDDICDDSIDFDQYRANLRLMALAQHAPHDCGDPNCPGVENANQLAQWESVKPLFWECVTKCQKLAEIYDFEIPLGQSITATVLDHLIATAAENKRKLDLYDKYKLAIQAFAEEGLLT